MAPRFLQNVKQSTLFVLELAIKTVSNVSDRNTLICFISLTCTTVVPLSDAHNLTQILLDNPHTRINAGNVLFCKPWIC